MIISSIKFILLVVFALVIPGYVLIKKLPIKSLSLKIFLSSCVGMVIIPLVAFIAGTLGLSWINLIILLVLNFLFFFRKDYRDFAGVKRLKEINKKDILVILLIIAGCLFQSLTMYRSGQMYDFGIGYWGPTARDGVWHQALIGQLVKTIPPQNPGFSATLLTNYHYFYDLLLAEATILTKIPIVDLVYRLFPTLFSLLFGVGTYHLAKTFSKSRYVTLFGLYFAYFSSSFGWIVEYLREKHFGGESAFWMNQPVSINLNPPFAISLILIIAVILLFLAYRDNKSLKIGLPLILISGVLIEFKVYAGLIIIGTLILISLESALIKKDFSYWKITLPVLLIASLLFFPQSSGVLGFMEFKPFWFVNSAIASSDRVGWIKLSQAIQAYSATGNWFKFILAEFLAFTIFVIGNLGTRILGIPLALSLWKKNFLTLGKYCFLFWLLLLSFIIPFFFIQKGNPWNTIQFGYYFLYFAALFTGVYLANLYDKWAKKFYVVIIFLLLLITPTSSYTTFTFAYTNNPPARLTKGEDQALNFLKEQKDGVVLTPAFNPGLRQLYKNPFPLAVYDTTSYVAAFSGKVVFLEDEIQQGILGNDYSKRAAETQKFFGQTDTAWSKQFLKDNKISYVYLPKLFNISLKLSSRGVKKIFENGDALLYEVMR